MQCIAPNPQISSLQSIGIIFLDLKNFLNIKSTFLSFLSLKTGRRIHSCGKIERNGKVLLVVASGMGKPISGEQGQALQSVEILDPLMSQGWKRGMHFFNPHIQGVCQGQLCFLIFTY